MSDTSKTNAWQTAITNIETNRVSVRGYDIAELMGNVSFGAAFYLIIKSELPNDKVEKLMNAILVSSMDHGATPPSALGARNAASTGASLSASVAAGILCINQSHGGAIENCARQLSDICSSCSDTSNENALKQAAEEYLAELKQQGKRMSGFGHRIHSSDPRTSRLFQLADEADISGKHVNAAKTVESIFTDSGKKLPINVDGAIGAILADLNFDYEVMNGFFMLARAGGLIAHVTEEKQTQRPMRRIDPVNHEYNGPENRSL